MIWCKCLEMKRPEISHIHIRGESHRPESKDLGFNTTLYHGCKPRYKSITQSWKIKLLVSFLCACQCVLSAVCLHISLCVSAFVCRGSGNVGAFLCHSFMRQGLSVHQSSVFWLGLASQCTPWICLCPQSHALEAQEAVSGFLCGFRGLKLRPLCLYGKSSYPWSHS